MDRIIIRDLRIYAHHGVHDFEKKKGQMFIVDADIYADLTDACQTDDLESTVNYSHAATVIKRALTAENYDLIERAAQAAADSLLAEFSSAECVRILLKKPNAPIEADFGYVAVEITRSRDTKRGYM